MLNEPLLTSTSTGNVAPSTRQGLAERDVSLDLMRGLIMLIMAWDHTTHQFTDNKDSVQHPGAESWNGPFASYDNNPGLFVSRAVSHICAPGFFFTMGIGMALFAQSRFSAGWSFARVWQHYLTRGAVLFLAGRLVNFPGYLAIFVDVGVHNRTVPVRIQGGQYAPGDEAKVLRDSWLSVYEVMEALALTMMLSPLFLPLLVKVAPMRSAPTAWRLGATELVGWTLFFFFFCASNLAIVLVQGDDPTDVTGAFPKSSALADNLLKVIARFTFWPGPGPLSYAYIAYPFIPWIGITCLGQGLGYLYMRDVSIGVRRARLTQMAAGLLAAFFVIRGLGGKFGNNRGWPRHDSGASAFMEFFIVCKYPPDLAYATITLAVDCLIILMFTHPAFNNVDDVKRADEGDAEQPYLTCSDTAKWPHPCKPVLVFGRAPLFFYICHFYVIGTFEAVLRLPSPPSGKFPLQGVVVVWALVVTVMYFACKRYVAFKSTTAVDSMWRLL